MIPAWLTGIFTLALVVATVQLGKVASQQTEILSHTDTALNASAQTAEKLRQVATTQAEIAREQLAEMQREGRAWVSIEPFLGAVTWDKDGVNINLKITIKNTGKIPALYVVRDARLVPFLAPRPGEDPYTILKKMTAEKRQGPLDVFGVPLFPNDSLDWFSVFKFSHQDMKEYFEALGKAFQHPPDVYTFISLTLVYFVDYTFGDDNTHHQHSCMCNISKVDPDNPARSLSLPINENLSPPNARLDSFPINCRAD